MEWYLAEINKIYSNEVEIIYFTTPTKVVEEYIEQSMEQRYENLNLTDIEWYLAEINKIYSDEVEIIFFTTPIKVVENFIEQSIEQKSENLRSARFRKTWFIRDGKNAGKGTIKLHFLAIQNCDHGHYDFQSRNLTN